VTVEENVLEGGFGSAVLECLLDAGIPGLRVKRIGVDGVFVEHGPQALLKKKYRVDASAVVEAAETLMGEA
jgi:1-deoxy-D-xylulose-5-phosphate synthase